MQHNDTPLDDTPFANLTPDSLLDALTHIGLPVDGRLLALNSFENRVYQFGLDLELPTPAQQALLDAHPALASGFVVAKFYRPARWSNAQILEEHTFANQLAERELPVVAPLHINGNTLHEFSGYRFAVFERRGGRAPEFDNADTLRWMGRFLSRIHAVGQLATYTERPALDLETFGHEPRNWLLQSRVIPPELEEVWAGVSQQALGEVGACFTRAGAHENSLRILRLHGDCHAGNVLWTDADANSTRPPGPHFVDFDDSRNGPAIQDLWMLLSGEREHQQQQLQHLLGGYEEFCPFDARELHLVEALRTLRLIHYSAWIARRWHDPAFPAAFPWFDSPRYWQDRILELREQIAAMQEPPLSATWGTSNIATNAATSPPDWQSWEDDDLYDEKYD